jgi:hypothetical protein
MAITANILPTAESDGVTYSTAVPLTTTEADLGDSALTPAPLAVVYGQVIVAVVQLSINGLITANTTYVVMQTDMGDGVWIDVAWIIWTGNQGSATFVLCGGVIGSSSNSFQQSRTAGAVPTPQANGSNAVPLAGRVRFVGKTTMTGGSSSLAGTTTRVAATIKYKLLTPR